MNPEFVMVDGKMRFKNWNSDQIDQKRTKDVNGSSASGLDKYEEFERKFLYHFLNIFWSD